jgi:hypothetical protein
MNYWESSSLKFPEMDKDLPFNLLQDLKFEEEWLIPDLVLESLSLLTVADWERTHRILTWILEDS